MDEVAFSFSNWFASWEHQLPSGGIPDELQDELLAQIQKYDDRLYFLLSTDEVPSELIISAEGNRDAFPAAEKFVAAAPNLSGWKFIALKPAHGFNFRHGDGPISLDVAQLWFIPLKSSSNPSALGISICFPDADFVLEHQSVDTAYTILESVIGERECTDRIAFLRSKTFPTTLRRKGACDCRTSQPILSSTNGSTAAPD
jgi:hypothetical protein